MLYHYSFAQQTNSPPAFEFTCGAEQVSPSNSGPSNNLLPICTDPSIIKYIRVAIHFLLPTSIVFNDSIKSCFSPYPYLHYVGAGNFTENGDGYQSGSITGFQRADDIINKANEELALNHDQWRKNPNSYYPPQPPQNIVRYLLTGVYFHRDDVAYFLKDPNNPSLSDFAITQQTHQKYNVGGNSILDVYYTPNGSFSGVGYEGTNKFAFANDYWQYVDCNAQGWSIVYSAQLLNHEIGHTLLTLKLS